MNFQERISSGKSGVCLCPAHEDSTPSMSVSFRDGKTLVYCHAGCNISEILEAAGLTISDLFSNERPMFKSDARLNLRRIIRKWRDVALNDVCKRLREKEALLGQIDRKHGSSPFPKTPFAGDSEDDWDILEVAYKGYTALEYDFERLNSKSFTLWSDVYKERGA
jgi:hypothetical protein